MNQINVKLKPQSGSKWDKVCWKEVWREGREGIEVGEEEVSAFSQWPPLGLCAKPSPFPEGGAPPLYGVNCTSWEQAGADKRPFPSPS